jgi:uncharacterized membrane protein YphA (DoxX/SURF4 family)
MAEATPIAMQQPRSVVWILLLVGRILLGAVFVYAAYTKLRVPWMLFAMSINSYGLLPVWALNVLARALPWLELLLGLLLMVGWKLRWVAACAAALLLVFFSAMVRAQSHGLAINCGCFGIGEQISAKTLVRDGFLVALAMGLALGAFVHHRPRRSSV